jgi:hypothetical protein
MTFDAKHPDQKLPEKPRNILKQGYKDSFQYEVKWKGDNAEKTLSSVAYRSGTGTAVSLIMTSVDHQKHWDLIPKNNSDLKWYINKELTGHERAMKGFKLLLGEANRTAEELLLANVEPRTCGDAGQGSAEWFLDRMFSGTSSTISELIRAVAPLLHPSDDSAIYADFLTVLTFCGDEDLLSSEPVESAEVEEGKEGENLETAENDPSEKKEAASWVSTLVNPDVDMDQEFKAELDNIDTNVLSWMQAILKDKPFKEFRQLQNTKFLQSWLEVSVSKRLFDPLTMPKLKLLAKAKKIDGYTNMGKPQLVQALSEVPTGVSSEQADEDDANIHQDSESNNEEAKLAKLAPLITLLKQSYLRPQKRREDRSATSIGHRNEEPFIKAMWNEYHNSNDKAPDRFSFEGLNIHSIYRPGLVRRKGANFVKGSADGLAVCFHKDKDESSESSDDSQNESEDGVSVNLV